MERFEQDTNMRIEKHNKEGDFKGKFRLDTLAKVELPVLNFEDDIQIIEYTTD